MWGRTSINTFILYLQKWREHKIYATLASHMLLWEPTMFPELNSFSNDRFQSCKFPTRHLITDVLIEKLILWNEHKGILCTYWLRGRTEVVNIWLRAQRGPNESQIFSRAARPGLVIKHFIIWLPPFIFLPFFLLLAALHDLFPALITPSPTSLIGKLFV